MTKRGAALTAALVSMALAGSFGALGACSLLVPLDAQQCSTDQDCLGRGEAFAGSVCANNVCAFPVADSGGEDVSDAGGPDTAPPGPWDCLNNPSQVTDPKATVDVSIIAFDALKPISNASSQDGGTDLQPTSYTPRTDVQVTACNVLDPLCGNPVAGPTATDDAGIARFSLAGNFVGVYRLQHPDLLPGLLFPGPFLAHAKAETFPTATLRTSDVELLASAIGVELETDAGAGVGHAFFQIYDCFDKEQAGVRFTMDIDAGAQTVQWYTKNQLPSTTATETDAFGAGGAVNVPVGALTVHATLAATGQQLGVVNAVIRPASTTFVWVRVRTH